MGRLSVGTIENLQPIAQAIDTELEKQQADRKMIFIECSAPTTLKNNLTLYKSMLRRDWNSRFWMVKRSNGLEINFQPSRKLNFTMHVGEKPPETSVMYNIVQDPSVHPGDGPALEMSDSELTQHLLMENPHSVQVLLDNLSDETKKYLADPLNAETSALINFLNRRGYKYSVLMNRRLRIFT
jgi:hypothetical protein